MRKLLGFFVAMLFIMVLGQPAFAQEKMIAPLPPYDQATGQLFGQYQWYSVVFRGNGESVVNAKITFTNSDVTAMKSVSLRVPKVTPVDPIAFQVIRQGICLQYATNAVGSDDRGIKEPACLRYEEPDIYSLYGPAKYQKTKTEYFGDTITITLPQPIQPDKSGSIMLYYRAFGYAKKDLVGAYRFSFETLQATEPVYELHVGISTDSDLVLRGTKSQVNYRFEDVSVASKGMAEMAAPSTNTRMDTYYQQIGTGAIVKTASNLQALESYTVKGSYANNRFQLYAKEIGIGLLIIILFAVAGYVIVQRMFQTKLTAPSANVLAVFVLSFMSAVITVGYSAVIMYIVENLSQLFGYQAQMPVMLLLLVISLGVYGLLLVTPALFIGIKRGLWYGLATAGLTVVWLVLALLLFLFLNMSRQNPTPYPVGVMKTLEKSVSSPGVQSENAGGAPAPQ